MNTYEQDESNLQQHQQQQINKQKDTGVHKAGCMKCYKSNISPCSAWSSEQGS